MKSSGSVERFLMETEFGLMGEIVLQSCWGCFVILENAMISLFVAGDSSNSEALLYYSVRIIIKYDFK